MHTLLAGFTGAFIYFIYPGLWWLRAAAAGKRFARMLDAAVVGEEEILLPVNAVKEHLIPTCFGTKRKSV